MNSASSLSDRETHSIDAQSPLAAHSTATDAALPAAHPPVNFGKVGIILCNLGTPDNYDFRSVRRYLKEFLSDRRVIEAARLPWWLILNGIILNTRPQKTGHAYSTIWDRENNCSPLLSLMRKLTARVSHEFDEDPRIIVDFAMRYGNPSVESVVTRIAALGCERILYIPLYPQYAAATSATACDKLFECLMKLRWQPAVRIAPPYGDDPAFIEQLAKTLEKHLQKLPNQPEKIIVSFHGIPQKYFSAGDPYHCHCQKTARLLREYTGYDSDTMITSFQSRFGPDEWLQPYTDETVIELAKSGTKRVAVILPGFANDCLETLEEIDIELRRDFLEAGGEQFSTVPCLNDSDEALEVVKRIIAREAAGWL